MKSAARGRSTSAAELLNVSAHGFWVFLEPLGRELFLPFREFPWFRDASIAELGHIDVERERILRWPDLDVDLDVARIEHPERYPLVSAETRKPAGGATSRTSARARLRSVAGRRSR
jgi:hypothetical protein